MLRCSAARCRRVAVTYEQWTGRFPRFWDASAYRATPPSLGTYGWRYPARYRVRERPLTGGAANATEWLVQVLLPPLPIRCLSSSVSVRILLPHPPHPTCRRRRPGSSPPSRTQTRRRMVK